MKVVNPRAKAGSEPPITRVPWPTELPGFTHKSTK